MSDEPEEIPEERTEIVPTTNGAQPLVKTPDISQFRYGPGLKRKNPVLFFPPKILDDINKAIDEGWKSPHLHHLLSSKWAGELKKVPCRVTLDRYLRWYLSQKKSNEDGEGLNQIQDSTKDIQRGLEKILDPMIPLLDKKQILELLVRKCGDRIRTLEKWQKTTISPAFESCLIRYFSEVRSLVETLAKLNNELQPDQQVIVNVVDAKIQPLFAAFYAVIKQIAPEKIEMAKILLKEEIQRSLTH